MPRAERSGNSQEKKSERTRAAILDAALELFQAHGYEGATMRAIAAKAGVSLGNAYYYFASKEHLIQGFYARMHAEHLARCESVLASETDLASRMRGVLAAKIDTAEPYHRFAAVLFKTAADPKSPLNPFSEASRPVREQSVELMRRVISGAGKRLPADLDARLPELLWMHLMGVVLFWIHDESPNRERTRKLADRTADLVARLVGIASLPLMRPLRRSALELVDELAATAQRPAGGTTAPANPASRDR